MTDNDAGTLLPFAKGSKRMMRHAAGRGVPQDPDGVPVVAYYRLSRNRDGEEVTGITRQRDEVRSFAEAKGWAIVAECEDDDTSAFAMKKPRPGFDAALAAVESGRARGIVVWKLDRLVRRVIEFGRVLPKAEGTPWFVASMKESVDTSVPFGRLIAQVLVAMAEMESANISVRSRSKHSEIAREGRWSGGGTRAFGHNRDRKTLREDEAAIVREIADRLLGGEAVRGIAGDLAARGIVGPGGKAMMTPTLRRLMLSPRLVGKRLTDDGDLSIATGMAPILDEATAHRVWAVLNRESGAKETGTARRHLFSGLLRCSLCGSRLLPWKQRERPAFACLKRPGAPQCSKLSIQWDPTTEEVMIAVALRHLSRVDLSAHTESDDRERERLRTAISSEQRALDDLALARYSTRNITEGEFRAARAPIASRLEALGQQLAEHEARPLFAGGPDVKAAWETWGFDQRRAALETAFEFILVKPGFAARKGGGERRRLKPTDRLEPSLRRL